MKLDDGDVKTVEKVGEYLDYWEVEGQKLASEMNLDLLLPLLGDKFDREALLKCKESSERAVRAILRDQFDETVPDFLESAKAHYRRKLQDSLPPEIIDRIVDNVPSLLEDTILRMVRDYQEKTFDPLTNFLMMQETSGGKECSLSNYKPFLAGFVGRFGRKRRYEREEVLEFMNDLYQRVKKGELQYSTYCTRYAYVKMFLKSLPDGGQRLEDFVPKPKANSRQPDVRVLTQEEIELLCLSAFLDGEPPWLIARVLCATVYGCRVSELVTLRQKDIDLVNGLITIPTSKKGEVKPQSIPKVLSVFLTHVDIPDVDYSNFTYNRQRVMSGKLASSLRRLTQTAGIELRKRESWHSIRHGLVDALDASGVDVLAIYKWIRWSEQRQFGTLPAYIRKPQKDFDARVIAKHPIIPIWREMAQEVLDKAEDYVHYLQ